MTSIPLFGPTSKLILRRARFQAVPGRRTREAGVRPRGMITRHRGRVQPTGKATPIGTRPLTRAWTAAVTQAADSAQPLPVYCGRDRPPQTIDRWRPELPFGLKNLANAKWLRLHSADRVRPSDRADWFAGRRSMWNQILPPDPVRGHRFCCCG